MNAVVNPKPSLFLRIAQFPLTRLLVLGGVLFLMMGVSNGFRAKYASAPLSAIVAAVGMTALAFAVYVAFARFIEKRAVSELSLHNLVRELGFGLLIGAGLYTACVLILMALGYYRIDGLNL